MHIAILNTHGSTIEGALDEGEETVRIKPLIQGIFVKC